MKTARAASLIAAVVIGAARPAGAQGVDRRAAVAPDVSVRVWVTAGSLRLIGWDRDSIIITGTVGAGETFFFDGDARAMKFGVEELPAGRTPQPSHLTAYVPRTGRVSVRTSSASIIASDLAGAFTSIEGPISLAGAATDVQADAVEGPVEVVMTAGMVRARTGGGDVTIGGSVADLGAATVSGDLTVAAQGIVRSRLESMTGSIIFTGDFGKGAAIEIDNHAGIVDLRIPPGLQIDLQATSVAGTITNTVNEKVPAKGVTKLGEVLSVPAGPGWPRIAVRTFKGEILVRYR
jgi:hypothetical protein